MKDKKEGGDEKVQGIDVIELGDAVVETKQNGVPMLTDSCCTFTYGAE